MELKAYNKIYSEAEDAIAGRRLFDALSLAEAIFKDAAYEPGTTALAQLRHDYAAFLRRQHSLDAAQRQMMSNRFFRTAIDQLQEARMAWIRLHGKTPNAVFTQKLWTAKWQSMQPLFERISHRQLGEKEYHASLDTLFMLLWCGTIDNLPATEEAMRNADLFAQRTLVGGLLIGLIDCFKVEKLQLLLALASHEALPKDARDAQDLQARIAVALTIVCQRYSHFFTFLPEEAQRCHDFFASEGMRPHLDTLLHAFTAEALVERVGQRVEDITPIIRNIIEKHQPHLGSDDEDEAKPTKKDKEIGIKRIVIEAQAGEELMDKLIKHVRQVDEMRSADLDINQSNFSLLKQFDFFKMPAHWLYPFRVEVPDISQALTRPNGKQDRITLTIMENNRFCASDSYSYVSMIGTLRHSEHPSITDELNDQLEELFDSMEEKDEFQDEEPTDKHLDPFTDYAQSLQRFFLHTSKKGLDWNPFAETNYTPLPLLPVFKGVFTTAEPAKKSIDTAMYLGDYAQAVLLAEDAIKTFGADAELLTALGNARMLQQQWSVALQTFQQLSVLVSDTEVELCIARCFEAMDKWQEALPRLLQIEKAMDEEKAEEADIADIVEETGRCLIQLRQWDDAAQHFFRLELMERHLSVARRAIAWCSIHQGKYERAVNYYDKLIANKKASWEDKLNRGHALWLGGKAEEATEAYRTSQRAFNSASKKKKRWFKHWSDAFQEDATTLLMPHYSDTDCALMLDTVTMPAGA